MDRRKFGTASPEGKQNMTRLCTITGASPVVGAALVNTLERVPVKNADAFVALHRSGSSPG